MIRYTTFFQLSMKSCFGFCGYLYRRDKLSTKHVVTIWAGELCTNTYVEWILLGYFSGFMHAHLARSLVENYILRS